MSQQTHQDRLRQADQAIAAAKAKMGAAKYRQRYHFMTEAGWMNDPNGLIYFRGQYHVFYQLNPYAAEWGAMHWGHAVSGDLLHWRYLPVALAPSEPYDDHPRGGVFSGSAVEDNGELKVLYTGTANLGGGFVQTQCLAASGDGIHFEKYPGNPVIPEAPSTGSADFRDPKVWRHDGSWYMVVGSCRDKLGKALLYKSADLCRWEYVNVLAESRGEWGTMWECPDVFSVGGQDFLMFSPMSVHDRKAVYLGGELDYKTGKLHYSTVGEVDWGFDAYAPQSLRDGQGRRIMVAWANNWDWMPWFKDFGPTSREFWCGALTLPRQIDVDPADGLLTFKPVAEIECLRETPRVWVNGAVPAGERMPLPAGDGISCEILAELDLAASTCSALNFRLRAGGDCYTQVTLDLKKAEISFDRDHADGWTRGVCRTALRHAGRNRLAIRLFLDTSSVEIYTDDYKTVLSGNVYPDAACNGIFLEAVGGDLKFTRIETYGIQSVW